MPKNVRGAEFDDRCLIKLDGCGCTWFGTYAGDEFEVPVTQAQLNVGSVCGSNAAESAASVAGLSILSSDGAIYSGSRARAVIGAIS